MAVTYSLLAIVAALTGVVLGAVCYRAWSAHVAKNKRRIPEQWQLRARPVFTSAERTVWHWLERVFFDHHVLVKTPLLRFLSPRSAAQSQHAHELLKGVYCSFSVCTSDGMVVGCVDVVGSTGLNASHRDIKKKLFEECAIAYAVLNPNQLPTLEALRAGFLGDSALMRQPNSEPSSVSQPHPLPSADMPAVPERTAASAPLKATPADAKTDAGTVQPGHKANSPATPPPGIDMTAVAAVRSNLQSKLDQNRKVRLTKADEISLGLGMADDKTDQKFAAPWDDSFIMGEDTKKPDSHKH